MLLADAVLRAADVGVVLVGSRVGPSDHRPPVGEVALLLYSSYIGSVTVCAVWLLVLSIRQSDELPSDSLYWSYCAAVTVTQARLVRSDPPVVGRGVEILLNVGVASNCPT